MLLPHGTLVALIDGKNFELLRNSGNEAEPELVSETAPKLDSHNHSGASHHSPSHVNEDAHAIAAVDWLNTQVLGHKIDHLVVIATPRTLGEVRKHYHKQLSAKLIGEFHKDLTGRQPREVLEALRASK